MQYLHFIFNRKCNYCTSYLSFVNSSFLVVRKCLPDKICRIMPRFAPLCIGVRYMVPWQMNNTFIGISYQNRINMLQFAPVCQVAETSVILQKIGPNGKVAQMWQSFAVNRSQNVVFYRVKNYSHPSFRWRGFTFPGEGFTLEGVHLHPLGGVI